MNKKLILTITIIPFLIFVPTVTVKATTSPYASGFAKGLAGELTRQMDLHIIRRRSNRDLSMAIVLHR